MAQLDKESEAKGSGVFLSFLAGAALGAGFALLAAPKSGKEMRDTISDLTDDAVSRIKQYASDAQAKLTSAMESGREMMKEKQSSVSAALDAGKSVME